jgi:hypothetical protein
MSLVCYHCEVGMNLFHRYNTAKYILKLRMLASFHILLQYQAGLYLQSLQTSSNVLLVGIATIDL